MGGGGGGGGGGGYPHNTLEPLYKNIHYKIFQLQDSLEVDPKNVVSKQKMHRLYRQMTIHGHFSI